MEQVFLTLSEDVFAIMQVEKVSSITQRDSEKIINEHYNDKDTIELQKAFEDKKIVTNLRLVNIHFRSIEKGNVTKLSGVEFNNLTILSNQVFLKNSNIPVSFIDWFESVKD